MIDAKKIIKLLKPLKSCNFAIKKRDFVMNNRELIKIRDAIFDFTVICQLLFFSIAIVVPLKLIAKSSIRIVGTVVDEISQHPISNVNIYFERTNVGTISDQDGNFSIDKGPSGSTILLVKHIGYFDKRISLKLSPGETKHLNIILTPKYLKLNEVIFTASRHAETVFKSHHNVTIADREEISIRTSPTTADAIREVPGVLVQKTTAGHGSPIIRGLIGKDVLLLYNGIRLNKPTFRFGANQYMNTINAETLDRIEVTKGPGSVMYGSDAIGGVVNMISEFHQMENNERASHTSLSLRYGSSDHSQIANASFRNRFGIITAFGGVGFKKIDNLIAGKDIGSQQPTGYNEWNGNLRFGVPLSQQTEIVLDFLTVQQNEVPRYDKYVTDEYETYLYDPQNRYLTAITLDSRPIHTNWINSIKWNLSYQFEQEGTIERKTNSNSLIKNRNDLTTVGSYLQINSIWQNRHIFTYGYEIYRDRVKSHRIRETAENIEQQRGDFPDGSTFQSFGIFLNDNIIFNLKFDLTLGIRLSRMNLKSQLEEPFGNFEDNYGDLTGIIGLSYKPKIWLNLIARYAKGFRAPNFNDTVVLKVSNAGVDAPSPGLSPEKSHNFEIGIKLNHSRYSGSMFIFYNRLVDLIDRYRGNYNGLDYYDENGNGIRDPGEVDIFQKRNVANAFITGWEISGRIQLSQRWLFQFSSFWTYGQNITFDEPMSRIPPFMTRTSMEFIPMKKLSFEAFFCIATRQDRLSTRDKDDSRIPEGGTPGWETLNFRCSWNIVPGLKLNFIVENACDETYKEHGSGVYSPGRSLVIGLKYGGNLK